MERDQGGRSLRRDAGDSEFRQADAVRPGGDAGGLYGVPDLSGGGADGHGGGVPAAHRGQAARIRPGGDGQPVHYDNRGRAVAVGVLPVRHYAAGDLRDRRSAGKFMRVVSGAGKADILHWLNACGWCYAVGLLGNYNY